MLWYSLREWNYFGQESNQLLIVVDQAHPSLHITTPTHVTHIELTLLLPMFYQFIYLFFLIVYLIVQHASEKAEPLDLF